MKTILLLILISLYGCASDSSYIASSDEITVGVYGIGETIDLAEKNGFRNAIQDVFGTLTLSNRQVINDALFEDEASYSRGVIRSFKTLSSEINSADNLYHLKMLVAVSATTLQGRFLISADSKNVDSSALSAQINSALAQVNSEAERYQNATKVLDFVTRNFGESYFKVETGDVSVERLQQGADVLVEVSVSVNEQLQEELCLAAEEFGKSRPAGPLPSEFMVQTLFGEKCYIYIMDSHFREIDESFNDLGLCLHVFDNMNRELTKSFHDVLSIGRYSYGMPFSHEYYRNTGGLVRFFYRNSNVNQNYNKGIIFVGARWAKHSLLLRLPPTDRGVLGSISKLEVEVAKKRSCIS